MRLGPRLAPFLAAVAILALFAATAANAAPASVPAGPRPALSQPIFSSLGTRDGLPNASVSGIAQDRTGFLWFGTQGGLVRYDGQSFKAFKHQPFDRSSLPHDLVQTIYLDGEFLWVGTYGGLARLDLGTETFVTYANDPDVPDSLSNDVVTSIVRDSRGSLWVGTMAGLGRLDEATGRFRRFSHDPADPRSLPADTVRALKSDSRGRLWVGTSGGGLALYDSETGGFRSYRAADGLLSDYVMAIDEDPRGGLWIGTWYGGLSHFDPETGRFRNIGLADDRVYALCAAEEGLVYVGTWGGGLFQYDESSGAVVRYRSSGGPGSLVHDVVYSLLRDSAGDLWIGTNGGGLSKLGRGSRGYELASAAPASPSREPEGLPPGKVYSLLEDKSGYFWAGVYNEGLARRDPDTGAWKRYRRVQGSPRSLPNDIVNCLIEDTSGSLWAGTNDGLARYDGISDSFVTLRPRPGDASSLSSEVVFALAEDPSDGALWIGTFRSGLDRWDRSSGSFEHYSREAGRVDSLSDNLVNALCFDSRGRLWVGTNKGLCRLEPRTGGEKGSFVRYSYDPGKQGGISSDSIKALFLDSRGLLWIGSTGGGLMRYEGETDSFVCYTMKDGLPSNAVLRILEDDSSRLWISTQSGLCIYDRASGRFRSLSVVDELRSGEFYSGACRARDGSLYFGSRDRIYRFDPGRYEFNVHRPPVAFTSIKAKGRSELGAAAAAKLKSLDLSWRENSIAFDFAALDYRDPSSNLYSYRLEGFDSNWSAPSVSHSANYTNLPGGRYIFRVRAANNDGLWNEEGIALPLRVRYAPFASPLALMLLALALFASGFALASNLRRKDLAQARSEVDVIRARLVRASASIESAAIVDGLTGLPNRRKAEEYLELAWSRASNLRSELSVLMIDIDRFKAYNDRFGRPAGDECLKRVAAALSSRSRGGRSIVARYGGEVFLAVLEDCGPEGALAEAEALRLAVEALDLERGEESPDPVVTVSVGYASDRPTAGVSPFTLLASAEKALVAAKQRGRNRVSD
jgi:diguanylate cyclase (GGDEF) domain